MTTTKTVPPTRLALLNCSSAIGLMNQMLEIMLQIQTMDAESLFIYKGLVTDLKKEIKDNAEIKFMEGILSLISAATKDALVDMDTLFTSEDDDDGTVLEAELKQVKTTDLQLPPPANSGTTIKATALYLTNDVLGTTKVGDLEMATVTETEGSCAILKMDVYGFNIGPWPAAYANEYQLIRPISTRAMSFWKGETKMMAGQKCVVIKCNFKERNEKQKEKAKADLIGNRG